MITLYSAATAVAWILSATFLVIAAEGLIAPTLMIESCLFLIALLFLEGESLTKCNTYNHFVLSLCVLWFALWIVSW